MKRSKAASGSMRGFRRAGRSLGRFVLRFVRLDEQIKSSLRRRLLDRQIEDVYRDLGEFVYLHIHDPELSEGDLVLMDVMRIEIVRLSEEKRLYSNGLTEKIDWDEKPV